MSIAIALCSLQNSDLKQRPFCTQHITNSEKATHWGQLASENKSEDAWKSYATHPFTAHADQFLELAKRYTDFSELTTPMLNEFIDKVLIHEAEYIDGERTQEIEIYLKFIGRFDLPAPEPTPEEVQKEEANSRRRRLHRELYHLNQSGERKPGDPFELTCQVCGQPFLTKRRDAMYCGASCRTQGFRRKKQATEESEQEEAIVIESA